MQTFYAIIGILVSVIAVVARVFFWNSGKRNAELKSTTETIENVAKAKDAADRVVIDSSYRNRVRNYFDKK